MYREYFGLKKKPFELSPTPEMLYRSRAHSKALNCLEYGIQEGTGFILLTGEVGAGKTTLIKTLLRKLVDNFSVSIVFNTRVTPEQLLAMINQDFGLETDRKNKIDLLTDLNRFLLAEFSAGRRSILIIDEAQNLSSDAIEEVRLLSNFEASDARLLQTILVGQPELRELIARPEVRQLRQRIALDFHLGRLNREETQDYIFFRLSQAGNPNAVDFEEEALDRIFELTLGTPRLINVCCDFILLTAWTERTRTININLVDDVAGNLSIPLFDPGQKAGDSPGYIRKRMVLHEKFLHELNVHYTRKLNLLDKRLLRLEEQNPEKETLDG